MRKLNKAYLVILFPFFVFFASGCSHTEMVQTPEKPVATPVAQLPEAPPLTPLEGSVKLVLKGEKGRVELTNNCSQTITEAYDGSSVLRKRVEELDFKIRTTTTDVSEKGNIFQNVETLSREGPGSLHDLAFPEEGELLDMELTPHGKVLKAGKHAKDSLFFLPSLPFSEKAVKQDEEWPSVNSWKSENTGAPMSVALKLKVIGKRACGTHSCIEVSVAGSVHFPSLPKKSKFEHKISGRFLFEPESALVPWSEFLSDEQLQGKGGRVVVHSRIRSELASPPGYHIANREEPSCPFENKAE